MLIEHTIRQIRDEVIALALMSGLGFSYKDWPFIKKMGVLNLIHSDLFAKDIAAKAANVQQLQKAIMGFAAWFEQFYQSGGWLISPNTNSNSRLFKAQQSPLVFYGRFNQDLLSTKTIAMVGSRNASADAVSWAHKAASTLAEHNVTIVSGGAMGIDQAAHQGALEVGGKTIVIPGMPCGATFKALPFKNFYEPSQIAIVYPFGPMTALAKFLFVERNRFVASLADAVVIVQGQQGSGTLYTAQFAAEMSVPMYAVPGSLSESRSFVPNMLLQQKKAWAVVDPVHLVAEVTKSKKTGKRRAEQKKDINKPKVLPELPYLLQVLKENGRAITMDEILAKTGKSLLELQKELLEYELSGRVKKQGAQFVLTGQ